MRHNKLTVFLLGFFSCAFLLFCFGLNLTEAGIPIEIGKVSFDTGIASSMFGEAGSPSDHIDEDDIIVLNDRVILKIKGVTLSRYADSGSMVPFLDKGANGIRIVPSSEEEIQVGDIVSFRINEFMVVHRVVEKGWDEDGVWFEMKGDANLVGDGRIRFSDIEYKTIGILY